VGVLLEEGIGCKLAGLAAGATEEIAVRVIADAGLTRGSSAHSGIDERETRDELSWRSDRITNHKSLLTNHVSRPGQRPSSARPGSPPCILRALRVWRLAFRLRPRPRIPARGADDGLNESVPIHNESRSSFSFCYTRSDASLWTQGVV
jgi:hypothetical protein